VAAGGEFEKRRKKVMRGRLSMGLGVMAWLLVGSLRRGGRRLCGS